MSEEQQQRFKDRYVFDPAVLPEGFRFPVRYLQIVLDAAELPDLTPWYFLAIDRQNADFWRETLRNQYPSRLLIPFAMRGDWNDTLACFDGADHSDNPNVFHVHAFTEPGWEHRGDWGSFDGWLKQAEIDSTEFKADAE